LLFRRPDHPHFMHSVVTSVLFHALLLGGVITAMTNPFAGRSTAVDLPVIRVALLPSAAIEKTKPTVSPAASRMGNKVVHSQSREIKTTRFSGPDRSPAVHDDPPTPLPAVVFVEEAAMMRDKGVSAGAAPGRLSSVSGSPGHAEVSGGGAAVKGTTEKAGVAPKAARTVSAPPRYRSAPHPAYPSLARERGYEGIVLLSVEVQTDGRVGDIKIKKSSGYSLLDQSALQAVKAWTFEPAVRSDHAARVQVDIPIRFTLSES